MPRRSCQQGVSFTQAISHWRTLVLMIVIAVIPWPPYAEVRRQP